MLHQCWQAFELLEKHDIEQLRIRYRVKTRDYAKRKQVNAYCYHINAMYNRQTLFEIKMCPVESKTSYLKDEIRNKDIDKIDNSDNLEKGLKIKGIAQEN